MKTASARWQDWWACAARNLGLEQLNNVQCYHLALTGRAVDWQIWIVAGNKPLPRKIVVTYKQNPRQPGS